MEIKIPDQKWAEFKKEMMERWHELTERDLERTQGRTQSLIFMLEEKLGIAFEEGSRRIAELAERYRLHEEPKEQSPSLSAEKKERVLELRPKKPANRDRKPKDDFHA